MAIKVALSAAKELARKQRNFDRALAKADQWRNTPIRGNYDYVVPRQRGAETRLRRAQKILEVQRLNMGLDIGDIKAIEKRRFQELVDRSRGWMD